MQYIGCMEVMQQQFFFFLGFCAMEVFIKKFFFFLNEKKTEEKESRMSMFVVAQASANTKL